MSSYIVKLLLWKSGSLSNSSGDVRILTKSPEIKVSEYAQRKYRENASKYPQVGKIWVPQRKSR